MSFEGPIWEALSEEGLEGIILLGENYESVAEAAKEMGRDFGETVSEAAKNLGNGGPPE